jgi:phage terminase large subunit GpA-like protein
MAIRQAFNVFYKAINAVIPAGGLLVSDWADQKRILSAEASAEPGKWRTDRVPYAREWMDVFNDPYVHTIVLMTSSQVAKSETINNICGYCIEHDPCPILLIQPTIDRMKDYSKKRIAPMIRDTPALAAVVDDDKSRDGDNTTLSKGFTGGHLLMAGANAASGLASNPIRVVLADEVDRYPRDVDGEGDPLSLAIVRTTTFTNRKIVITSTPTIKGESRVEEEFELGDKRQYHVPCPECGVSQVLKFSQLVWETDEEGTTVTSIHYACEVNGCAIDPHHKLGMLDRGEWIAEKPHNGVVSFHINALYSVWLDWKTLAERFIKANNEAKKGKPELLKTFTNTMLGECWNFDNENPEIEGLENRAETYIAEVPLGVLCVTAGVDVQPDRIECEVVGWGHGEESWSLNYYVLWGTTSEQSVWGRLLEVLTQKFECEREDATGTRLVRSIDAACIDSGGHNTQQVYDFTKRHRGKKFLAIKGLSTRTKEAIATRPTVIKGGALLYGIGTDLIKDALFGNLDVTEIGAPGYCHFPIGYDEEYFKQLKAEKRVKKIKKFDKNDPHGYSQWMYKKIRSRNEALDCRVYAYAALKHLNPNFDDLLTRENLLCAKKTDTLYNSENSLAENKSSGFARKFGSTGGFVSAWQKGR